MKKYRVKKETYKNELIEDLGLMTIEELREYAHQFIGDVFYDEKQIDRDMEYIEREGDELWACKYQIQINIYLESQE